MLTTGIYAYHTVNYNAKNGIASNGVRKIFIDHTHRVWLGTDNGVSMFSGNGIKNYVYSNGLNFNKIWEITECPDSSLWFGSFGKGLYSYKNNQFINYPLPRSKANNAIRKLHPFRKLLFIGTEAGLNVFDYKKHRFIPFKNLSQPDSFQILDFFEYKNRLYFQSFHDGTFVVNYEKRSFEKIHYNENENKWNYSAYQHNGTLYLARTKFNANQTHNLLKLSMDSYLNGLPMDSLQISTVIWEFAHTANEELYTACYGVRDDTGGLYKQEGESMVKINNLMGINSNQLWDICYDKPTNKLYVASIDKGLFTVDFNQLVELEQLCSRNDILDLKISNGKLFILTKDTLLMAENGIVNKVVSLNYIKKIVSKSKPTITLEKVPLNSPFRVRDLSISPKYIVINSNFAELRFDLDLNLIDYIGTSSDGRLCYMKNNDVLIFRDYGNSELCENFGLGNHEIFKHWEIGKTNPRDVNQYCKLNDTTFLLGSENSRMYIYKQGSHLYKRFNELGTMNLPGLNERLAENQFVSVDCSNVLYKGVYTHDTLLVKKVLDLRSFGVIETYFVKVFGRMIIIATNKGIFILDRNKIYLVDKSYGLPDNIVLRTAQYLNGLLYIATSEGIYTIDIQKLKSISCDYHLSNLVINVDSRNHPFQFGSVFRLHDYPTEIIVNWELNDHPYPEKLQYSYRINDEKNWHKVLSLGQLRISEPNYGNTTIYLRIKDEVQNNTILIKLLTVNVVEPFYRQLWFIILLVILLVSAIFILFYRIRIIRLKSKAQKAMEEKQHVQLKLDTLQFLLKPHFIFNALTSIQNLIIKKDMDKSLEYSGLFSKFLRGVMQNSGEDFICLQEELRNINNYIELEKLRFNADIDVQISIAENIEVEKVMIIPFLFQPLLENTFKHAFTKDILQPQICISVNKDAEMIEYRISDNGVGLKGESLEGLLAKSASKGLKITIAQLDKFYNYNYSVNVAAHTPQGVLWLITTPL